jgi:hypothetical protein
VVDQVTVRTILLSVVPTFAESSSENEFVAEITKIAISWIGLRIGPTGGRIWLNDMQSGYHNLTCE